MTMPKILLVFPTAWDEKQLAACRHAWEGRFELELTSPSDEDCPASFDVVGFIDRIVAERRGSVDGVLSSSDYPGATVAGAIATGLGLPGPRPAAVLSCSHKYYSRLAQRQAVPEATPRFDLVRAGIGEEELGHLDFPRFVKPVKGAFSVLSRRVDSARELAAFLAREEVAEFAGEYMLLFNRLLTRYTSFEVDGSHFLAEELLHGRQTTVEGFACDGAVEILGVVDSVMHPGTGSFSRFDYPSTLPREIQERMENIARRAIARLGLDSSLFNIEMIYEPSRDRIDIIEVNPRLCGQFADLYAKVDGVSGYQVALALAAGERPRLRRREGPCKVASSFPLRVFEPVRVLSAPGEDDLAAAEELFVGTLVWNEIAPGQELSDFLRIEDGKSFRYGVVNVGGASRRELLARFRAVRSRLGYQLEPLAAEAASS